MADEFSERTTRINPISDMTSDETLTLDESNQELDPSMIGRPWYPGKVIEGLYRIEGEIARGGMGVIHKATDLATNNFVVIKSLLPEVAQDEGYKKRFIREAEEWVNLGVHPNLVRCYTAHEIEYLPRIIAEYIDGQDLRTLIKRGLLPFNRALNISVQICWGMAFAHDKELAHRDLKPANILMDWEGNVKVTDFGLVKHMIDDQSETKVMVQSGRSEFGGTLLTLGIIGTPEYIAPEQWEGRGGKQSDIYAFGIILYELFCGRRPFEHKNLEGVSRITAYHLSHTKETVPAPETMTEKSDETLPKSLAQLMQKCLEKSAAERPKSFRDLANHLNQIALKTIGQEATTEPTPQELDRKGKLDQGNAFIRLGHGCIFRGDNDKAGKLYQKAKEIFESLNDQIGMANYYWSLSRVNVRQGNYAQSMKMNESSLEIFEALGDNAGIARCYNNMGSIQFNQGNYDQAMEIYKKSLNILEALGAKAGIALTYNNMGLINENQGNYDQAMEIYQKSLAIFEALGNKAGIALSYNNMGKIKYHKGDYDQATDLYQNSLELSVALGYKELKAETLAGVGRVYSKQGQTEKAMKVFNISLEIAKELKLSLQTEVQKLIDELSSKPD